MKLTWCCLVPSLLLAFWCQVSVAQVKSVSVSGIVLDIKTSEKLPYVNVVLAAQADSSFVKGTVSDELGRFVLIGVAPGNYVLQSSFIGYQPIARPLFVGTLSEFVEVPDISLAPSTTLLEMVEVEAKQDEVSGKLDKKVFTVADNINQSGGSVLQLMQNLPGLSVQDGKVIIRGSDKVAVLIDGQQNALTGMGNQSGLDNIPASAIERIEIINNPSAKYDANGNAGIVNIIYKKGTANGVNGKVGLTGGVGSLWIRRANLPEIRPQYQFTPKVNPSISFNYRRGKVNLFVQADYLFTQTLNKNEFTTRTYTDGTVIQQQTKRNRDTHFATAKAGFDWNLSEWDMITLSGMYGTEKILDHGDEPFYNSDLTTRLRLWQFLEDELKTTGMASASYQHKFRQPGQVLNVHFNYTFHREDEKYFFDNIMPTFTGHDAFALISDEHVADLNTDYAKPLKYGRVEAGAKFRWRQIPTNMQFIPGQNSPLDTNAGGAATYNELIPAIYGNYVYESKRIEAEVGVRLEYVKINYEVGPNHPTYRTDGYDYIQPFPNIRLAYRIGERHKLSLSYNRRVDRPNEVDIRIFPKYDDAEIIKVGNPALCPQFTQLIELGYKASWSKGYFYAAAYHRLTDGTMSRIASRVANSTLIYSIFQNAGRSYTSGLEIVIQSDPIKWFSFTLNLNGYHNYIASFVVENKYPIANSFTVEKQQVFSGNAKLTTLFHLPKKVDLQFTVIYLAPDIVPQGTVQQRFTMDLGIRTKIQKDKGELFLNVTDLANSMVIEKQIQGTDFSYVATDYYETQVVRLGYSYKF